MMKPVFILTALMLILASGFAQAQHQRARGRPRRIIDMHFHIWETALDPAAAADRTKVSQGRGTALEKFQQVLNRYNVEMVLVSGPVDLVQAIVQSAPKRFIGGPAFTESIRLPSIPTLRLENRAGKEDTKR